MQIKPLENEHEIQRQVREFYDRVGWKEISEGLYQNARYEDLRPVSQEYIHRCHLRITRHLHPKGHFFLDAGSGPIQYPEYLDYSRGYQRRVCADISIQALQEARRRIGVHGSFVVADITCLPFKADAFDGVISLHTIHHLPVDEHLRAYQELHRGLAQGCSAVVVTGGPKSRLIIFFEPLIRLSLHLRNLWRRLDARQAPPEKSSSTPEVEEARLPKGTFINRNGLAGVKTEVSSRMPVEIRVWRSASVLFLRSLIRPWLVARPCLRLLFWLEGRFPRW